MSGLEAPNDEEARKAAEKPEHASGVATWTARSLEGGGKHAAVRIATSCEGLFAATSQERPIAG